MSGGTAGSLQGPFNYCVCSRNQPAWGLPLRQWGGSGPAHVVSGCRGSQESGTSCDLASWTKVVHHLVRLRADSAGTPEKAGQHDCPSGSHFGQVACVACQPPGAGLGGPLQVCSALSRPWASGGIRAGHVCLGCPASAFCGFSHLIRASLSVYTSTLRSFIQTPRDSQALQQLRL